MQIIHIVRQYHPSVGGLEDAVRNLCLTLSRREGVSVRIVTLNRVFTHPENILPAHEMIDGISVTRLPYRGSSRYPIAPAVLREIASADIVHVHAIDFFFDFLSLTRFIHRKPLVASTHGGFFHSGFAPRLKKIWFQTITRFSARGYKAICTSSENDAATFRSIAAGKIVTVENGVNVDKWKNRASAEPRRAMIFIGRWAASKRVPVLIDLVAALKKQGQEWSLIIAGIEGDETAASLQAHAEGRDVADRVHIHARPSEAEIGLLIGQSSYIASASAYEGFGISAVEGLSAGLMPLLSPLAPFDKLRRELGFGAIIDPAGLDQSARNIEQLHAEFTASPAMMREGALKLARRYDWPGVTDRFMDIYRTAAQPEA
ncbi:MAG: glycosyltransferase family 4 protein [Alphaproteobacteria bacterium]|nr:glycosyltransferase family 4 protein [Alphaproteobacteria bacterium]